MENLSDQFNKSQLINDLKVVVDDTEALLQATENAGGEKLKEIRAKAETSLNMVKARIADTQEEVLARTRVAAKATDVYVHENPWRSVGFAASLGIVIGLLISRR